MKLAPGHSKAMESDTLESASFNLRNTTVSTKVVPQKRKRIRDNADWYYG